MFAPAIACDANMSADYLIGAAVSVLLTAYLLFALLKPERF
jgi:K+-transporting ATPase KdpF subunit